MFRDDRGTSVPYPRAIFSTRAEDGEPRGPVLTSADGRARLHIFSLPNSRNETPARFIARVIEERGQRLTYRRVTRSFFVFSAPAEGRILYRRCNFARDGVIHCIDLRYPAGEKRAWDGVVTRISLGLRPQ
jgi:hypothetical protein